MYKPVQVSNSYCLKEGAQTFGSHPSNDIVFPEKAAAFIGTLTLSDERVHVEVNDEVGLYYENERVNELELSYDSSGAPSYITHGDFAWYIMKRHNSLAIRLRDYKNPAIEALDHIPSYPIDPDYIVEATLHPFDESRTITVNTPCAVTPFAACPMPPPENHLPLEIEAGEKKFLNH